MLPSNVLPPAMLPPSRSDAVRHSRSDCISVPERISSLEAIGVDSSSLTRGIATSSSSTTHTAIDVWHSNAASGPALAYTAAPLAGPMICASRMHPPMSALARPRSRMLTAAETNELRAIWKVPMPTPSPNQPMKRKWSAHAC